MFRRFRTNFHDDWCDRCTHTMEIERKQLYAMPDQLVGHYISQSDPAYYKAHLIPVNRKDDIPTGMYACGLILYRCPDCGFTAVKVSVFLPVRGVEKAEDAFYFKDRELDDFVRQTIVESQDPPPSRTPGSLEGQQVIRDSYYR